MTQGGAPFRASVVEGGVKRNINNKRKAFNIEFNLDDSIPFGHHRTEPLVIAVSVGRTLIHKIYVYNRISVNIINENYLKYLPGDVHNYVQFPTSTIMGFAGQSMRPVGKVSLPFTLKNYRGSMQKNILT